MDFTQPQEPLVLHGFPLYFRCVRLSDAEVYWVPRGISRNEASRGWRIWLRHKTGTFTLFVGDKGEHRSASLRRAWDHLDEAMSRYTPYERADHRERTQGKARLPVIDTGVTGVTVARETNRKAYRGLSVVVVQMVIEDGQPVSKTRSQGSISWAAFDADPVAAQRKFENALEKAVAIRRYNNFLVAENQRPPTPLSYADVPKHIRDLPFDTDLAIEDLFASFV